MQFRWRPRRPGRTLAAVSLSAVTVVALAAPALAHVTVNPDRTEQGGWARLTFRVPNEQQQAGTVGLRVDLPSTTPIGSVSYKPKPGWDVTVHTTKLPKPVSVGDFDITEAVTSITWTARKGVSIRPGQFDEFDISGGPMPSTVSSLELPAFQTYDNGDVVKWTDKTVSGKPEPEHPAPVLHLVPAGKATADVGSEAAPGSSGTPSSPAARSTTLATGAPGSTATDDAAARWLGGGGLAVGVLGCLLALAGLAAARWARRTTGSDQANAAGSASKETNS